jgi:hypothetical protein
MAAALAARAFGRERAVGHGLAEPPEAFGSAIASRKAADIDLAGGSVWL